MSEYQQLINGQWCGAVSGDVWELVNPSTESVIDSVPFGDGRDATAAIDAAAGAQAQWAAVGPYGRAEILHRAADLLHDRAESYGAVMTEESGKPLGQSVAEWRSAPNYLRYAADEAKRIGGRIIPSRAPNRRIDVTYRPVGVVGVISAWNFPVYNINRAVASALAAGCTVVVRPSEFTPRSAFLYAATLADAGVPPGVINVINGEPHAIAQTMLSDPRLHKMQFTGSTRVGKILMDGASRTVTDLSLELGGNAPVIVMPDVHDIEAIARSGVEAKYRNGGQVCIAPQRFLVHSAIVDEFTNVVRSESARKSVGDPMLSDTDIGPLINDDQRSRVESIVQSSVDTGATVETGGTRVGGPGFFYQPTVLSGDLSGTAVMTEEVFGPVLPITSFDLLDEALEIANSVEHGLTAFVWTAGLETAIEASERLDYGMVGVNDWYPVTAEAPFGGVKQSGLGRESGTEGILEYLEPKTRFFGGLST